MSKQPFSWIEHISEFSTSVPPDQLRSLADSLRSGSISTRSSSLGLSNVPELTLENASRVFNLFSSMSGQVDEIEIATALSTAAEVMDRSRSANPILDIVWSGPRVVGPFVRSTDSVILEMLESAQASGEILVVGYSFTVPKKSAMEKVVDALETATSRGVQVKVVMHSDEDDTSNLENLMDEWDKFIKKPDIFTWTPDDPDAYTKMHAKCLVIDRMDALVTSANLTFHGLESNLELGVRIRGSQAGAISEIFDNLISSGELRKFDKQ
jgi:phosphatidylserine/phosphatidylglycerophosphate/cardiolipin synthase-like enzyme